MHRDPLPEELRAKFCLALKAARERRGITLSQIAASTKIAQFHLAALERADLRHWPKGLFRRSFFRDYARAIGLPAAEACSEFVRLFPEDEAAPIVTAARAVDESPRAEDVRLALDAEWRGPRVAVWPRLLAAMVDVGFVALVPIAWARMAGRDPTVAIALMSLAYLAGGTLVLGTSPAMWIVSRQWVANVLSRVAKAVRSEPAEEQQEEAVAPPWISDARRVGPAPESPLRVRFKLQ